MHFLEPLFKESSLKLINFLTTKSVLNQEISPEAKLVNHI